MFNFLKSKYHVTLEVPTSGDRYSSTGESFDVRANSIDEAIDKARSLLDAKYGKRIFELNAIYVDNKKIRGNNY